MQILNQTGNNYTTSLDGCLVTIVPKAGQAPQIQSTKWGGEYYCHIQLQGLVPPNAIVRPSYNAITNVAQWTDSQGNVHKHFVKVDPNGFTQDGLLEHSITFNSKPVSNGLIFSVDCSPNIEWCYQPALTQDEIDAGAQRPANVVGSYALYIDKAHKFVDPQGIEIVNYATGKYCHIYALTLTDANNNVSYAPLNYNPLTKKLIATMDNNWLTNATYPVVVDPEIGYHSNGSTLLGIVLAAYSDIFSAARYTASAGDVITKYSAYLFSGSGYPYTCGMTAYDFNGSIPVNRLAQETVLTITDSNTGKWWDSSTVSQSLTNGTVYIVAMGHSSSTDLYGYYDTGGSNNNSRCDGATALPDPWVDSFQSNYKVSIYATVTQGGQVPYQPWNQLGPILAQ